MIILTPRYIRYKYVYRHMHVLSARGEIFGVGKKIPANEMKINRRERVCVHTACFRGVMMSD